MPSTVLAVDMCDSQHFLKHKIQYFLFIHVYNIANRIHSIQLMTRKDNTKTKCDDFFFFDVWCAPCHKLFRTYQSTTIWFLEKTKSKFLLLIFFSFFWTAMRSISHHPVYKKSVFYPRIYSSRVWMDEIFNFHRNIKSKRERFEMPEENLWMFNVYYLFDCVDED